jgi:hypothetical protein
MRIVANVSCSIITLLDLSVFTQSFRNNGKIEQLRAIQLSMIFIPIMVQYPLHIIILISYRFIIESII